MTDFNLAMTPRRMTSANWRTPSRFIMRARWTSTVRTLIPRSQAMNLFGQGPGGASLKYLQPTGLNFAAVVQVRLR
jgi:hypothetical protein